jgi:hypothetical protein
VDKPTVAILLTLGAHVVGLLLLFSLLLEGKGLSWREWWPGDDDGGDPPAPAPDGPGDDGVPLDGAQPAGVRLRTEHERLGAARRRVRRPAHAPQPDRTREPA